MTKSEIAILAAKDPTAYIDASLRARIPPAAKARLARQWMEQTGYSREDILHARNRHPYWKKKKMEGSAERTRRRLSAHDYSSGGTVEWNADRVSKFLELNAKDKGGRYLHRDWEIAEAFGASIPSIQYMRRKFRRAEEMLGSRASKTKLVEYLTFAESVLVRGSGAVEKLRTERAKEAKLAASAKRGGSAKKGKVVAKPAKAAVSRTKTGAKAKSPAKPAQKAARRRT